MSDSDADGNVRNSKTSRLPPDLWLPPKARAPAGLASLLSLQFIFTCWCFCTLLLNTAVHSQQCTYVTQSWPI